MVLLCQHLSLLIHTQIQSGACITLPLYYACTGHDSDSNTLVPADLHTAQLWRKEKLRNQNTWQSYLEQWRRDTRWPWICLQWPSPVLNVGDLYSHSLPCRTNDYAACCRQPSADIKQFTVLGDLKSSARTIKRTKFHSLDQGPRTAPPHPLHKGCKF